MRQKQKNIYSTGLFGLLAGGTLGFLAGKSMGVVTQVAEDSLGLYSKLSFNLLNLLTQNTAAYDYHFNTCIQLVYKATVKASLALGATQTNAESAAIIAAGQLYKETPYLIAVINSAARSTWLGTLGLSLGTNPWATGVGALTGLAGGVFVAWLIYRLYEFLRTNQSRELDRILSGLNTEEKRLRNEIKETLRATPEIQSTMKAQTKQLQRLQTEYNTTSYLESDVNTPEEFLCPITLCIMKNPVNIHDNHIFEKIAITLWYRKNSEKTCPLDRRLITQDPGALPIDEKLKSKINEYIQTQISLRF